jgi:hypothetical protein
MIARFRWGLGHSSTKVMLTCRSENEGPVHVRHGVDMTARRNCRLECYWQHSRNAELKILKEFYGVQTERAIAKKLVLQYCASICYRTGAL